MLVKLYDITKYFRLLLYNKIIQTWWTVTKYMRMCFGFSDLESERETDMKRKVFWKISFFHCQPAKFDVLRSLEFQSVWAKKKLVTNICDDGVSQVHLSSILHVSMSDCCSVLWFSFFSLFFAWKIRVVSNSCTLIRTTMSVVWNTAEFEILKKSGVYISIIY